MRGLQRFVVGIVRKIALVVMLVAGGATGAVAITVGITLLAPEVADVPKSATFSPVAIGSFQPLYERSVVTDRYGNELAVLRSEQNRTLIPLDKMPKALLDAVVDTEDAAFYRHKGVNVRATARALFANVEAGGVAQGGSTITQQLVKNTLLTNVRDLNRKVKEARLAVELERTWTKNQILERYLNTVYFGEGAYGAEAAAERYFNRPAMQLDVAQSAFLAGLIRNPNGYDVVRFPERARARRAVVLDRMVAEHHLGAAAAEQAKTALLPRPKDRLKQPDTYFVEEVKQRLLDDPRLGATKEQRFNAVFNGGLRIVTTLDPAKQADAEKAVHDVLDPTGKPQFTAAVASVDPTTGAVRAMVGGRGFDTDKYNLATQGQRQPGSSWKPFTLIAAVESGISTSSYISGIEPCPIPNPGGKPDPYMPGNSERSSGRVASLVDQITISSNCAFARLAYVVGPDKVISVARRLGISTRLDPVPAMALGSEEVHPLEMAGAYATLASEGIYHPPYLVERVEDANGKVIFSANHAGRRAIAASTADAVTDALTNVVRRGTGTRARLADRPVAGKTGTAQSYEDAWFVGYTPQLATAVWMGDPASKVSMRNVGGISVMGGTYPARIWHAYMSAALAGAPVEDFTPPVKGLNGPATCLSVVVPSQYRRYGGSSSTKRSSSSRTSKSAQAVVVGGGRGFAIELGLAAASSTGSGSSTGTGKVGTSGPRGCSSGVSTAVTTAKKKRVVTKKKNIGDDTVTAVAQPVPSAPDAAAQAVPVAPDAGSVTPAPPVVEAPPPDPGAAPAPEAAPPG